MKTPSLEDQVVLALKTYRGDNVRLIKELKKLLRKAEQTGDVYVIGRINMHISSCYFDLGNRVQILPYAVKAVSIFEELKNRNMLARSHNILGIAYHAEGNYQRSMKSYYRALEAIRGLRKPAIKRHLMINNIAQCYYQMGEYQKSLRLVQECYSIIRKRWPEDHASAVIYGINLSDCYESLENYQSALDSLDLVREDAVLAEMPVLLWAYYARRCCVLYKLGDPEEGAKFADLTIETVYASCDSYEGHRDFEKIAAQQVKVGDFPRAQRFADILTKYAETIGHTLDRIQSKRVQANICYAKGERDRALALFKELNGLYESWMDEERKIQYESQKNVENAIREVAALMDKVRLSEEKAERDPLTGLRNRSAMVRVTDEFIHTARAEGKKLGVLFFDIDLFKAFNDSFGHAVGDEIIKFVASICLEEENDTVKFFRYGGDEYFGVVLGCTDEEIEALALRIARRVRASAFTHGEDPNGKRLTVSIGIANVDMRHSESTLLDMIQGVDKALYHAKEHGRDCVFACRLLPDSEYDFRLVTEKQR